MSIVGIIPARSGSKGVPQKNIRLLKGYPIIAYSIIASLLATKIDRTIVSTDSEEIAEISRRYGAEVPFLRPSQYAADQSPDIAFVMHALNWFIERSSVPRYLVHLRPTTPLRNPEVIDAAITDIINNHQATSLRSGHIAAESPLKWFLRDELGYFRSISTSYSNDAANAARQTFPAVYIPDGYVDVLVSDFIIHSKLMHGDKMIGFVSPACQEIDTLEDLEYLEFLITKHGSVILDYLCRNFSQEV